MSAHNLYNAATGVHHQEHENGQRCDNDRKDDEVTCKRWCKLRYLRIRHNLRCICGRKIDAKWAEMPRTVAESKMIATVPTDQSSTFCARSCPISAYHKQRVCSFRTELSYCYQFKWYLSGTCREEFVCKEGREAWINFLLSEVPNTSGHVQI